MTVLITGTAGFIGYHVAKALLDRGDEIIGVDNLNKYYDVRLKEARLALLQAKNNFTFHQVDISNYAAMQNLAQNEKNIRRIIHLAAQAGVRHSIEKPFVYVQDNLV